MQSSPGIAHACAGEGGAKEGQKEGAPAFRLGFGKFLRTPLITRIGATRSSIGSYSGFLSDASFRAYHRWEPTEPEDHHVGIAGK